jgi:hypothetical protein
LFVQFHRFAFRAHAQVEHFHRHRKRHRKVDIALRDMETPAFSDQRHADQRQE